MTRYACGHVQLTPGCGGCDPGAIEFTIRDGEPRVFRCVCCDLPVESCGRAAEQRARVADVTARRMLRTAGWWGAQFGGTCDSCGERFEAGDPLKARRVGSHWGYVGGLCCAGKP